MSDNRNCLCSGGQDNARGTICINTNRVMDSCRDRDCFENARVYLSPLGEQTLNSASNVRAISSSVLWAYVGVDEVPFNCGFYRVNVRYYILTEFEACLGLGRSQTFKGLSAVEKDVILYGGEGNSVSFSSDPNGSYCSLPNPNNRKTNAPVAVVETVEPIILGSKVVDCSCPCQCNECIELPDCVKCCLDGDIVMTSNSSRLYISLGIFSVVRVERPTQILVQATDYSVPDKECVPATNDENPCSLFQNMEFPSGRFRAGLYGNIQQDNSRHRGCGCQNK